MKHKLMQAMTQREANRKLGGIVQLDDAYLGLSSQLCNQVFHSAFIGTRSSPNITWKLCRAGFQ